MPKPRGAYATPLAGDSVMRYLATLSIALIASAAALAQDAPRKGFVVHEWGVFRVNDKVEYANADLRAEWDDLPEFVYGHIKGRAVPQYFESFEIRRRPIVFFHATESLTTKMTIQFPGGQAGVWFPATENPAVFADQKQPKVGSTLTWNLGVKAIPQGWQPKQVNRPAVSEKHWISRIRQVKCDSIYAKYSRNPLDVEHEKFVYYDGIFPQGKWLKIDVEKDRVALKSQVKHPVFDVTVVDRRGEKVRIGRIAKLDAGATITAVKFEEVDASRFSSETSDTLLKQLTGAGLYEDEAKSLVDLWKKELFETPGLNLFYRLPQEEYDVRLPMTLSVKPESVVRVGLVYHAHLEPDFAARILELAKQLDAERFGDRDAALKNLLAIGPAALVELQRLRDRKDLSIEVRERIDALIKKWNSKEGFDQ
jgi:hypothetical protein